MNWHNILLVVFILISVQTLTAAEKCSRPNLQRKQAFIYRSIGKINTRVYRCLYNDSRNAYSDISDQCLSAFKTQKFLDKWDQTHILKQSGSAIVLEEYVASADPLKNQIFLRSGTICRYDRGFCYDPNETISYAATWDTMPVPINNCPDTLEQVFYGYVDFWTFNPENLKYLFYYDPNFDRAFHLRLTNTSKCLGKAVRSTDERGYIVSLESLRKDYRPTKKLNQDYFPLKSKRVVSEAILKDCDLNAYSADFGQQIKSEYLVDPENLRIIFRLYQSHISYNRRSIEEFTERFKKLRMFLEGETKNVKNLKMLSDLYKKEFDKVKNELKSLKMDLDIKYSKAEQHVQSDLDDKVKKMQETINTFEKVITTFSTNKNQDDLNKQILNLKNDIDEKFLSFYKNISNSIPSKIEKQLTLISSVSEKYHSECNQEIDNLKKNFELLLKKLKEEMVQNDINLESKIMNSMKFAENKILEKISLSNLKIENLEKDINNKDINNKNNVHLILNKLNIFNTTTALKFQEQNKNLSQVKDNLELRYKLINEAIEKNSKECEKSINNSFSSRFHSSDSKVQNLEKELKNHKTYSETTKNSIDSKLENLVNKLSLMTNTMSASPKAIEENIFKQINPMFDSVKNQNKICSDNVESLKKSIPTSVEDLKKELLQLFREGDKTVTDDLNNAKNNFSGKLFDVEKELRDIENKLKENDFSVNANKDLIERRVQEIRRSISSIFDLLNEASSKIDKNILNKYNSLMDQLKDKSTDCMKEIENLKHTLEESMTDIKLKIYESFILNDKDIMQKLEQVNNTLLKKIKESDFKIQNLDSSLKLNSKLKNDASENEIKDIKENLVKTNQLVNDIPSKIEEDILKKINPSLDSLNIASSNCETSLETLKTDFNKSLTVFKNEVFDNFVSTADGLEYLNNTIIKIAEIHNKKIQILENKTNNLISSTKSPPINDKIRYLIQESESTQKKLEENVNDINNFKIVMKELKDKIDNLESNNEKDLYERYFNETLQKNKNLLIKLQDDINNLKKSDIEFDKHSNQINQLIVDTKENINTIVTVQQQLKANEKNINQIKADCQTNQQQLNQFQKEFQIIQQNISVSHQLLSNKDKEIKDLKTQIVDMKNHNEKNEKHFEALILDLQHLIDQKGKEILGLKGEIANTNKCCSNNQEKLKEKDGDIQKMRDEFNKQIDELKQKQRNIEKILNADSPVVDPQ